MDAASLIGKTIGHYEVTGLIGQGGMGVVYRARDLRLERDVALKVLRTGALGDDVARKRFRAEALSLSRLNHPNIATIHDFDSEGGIDFVVMECIAGAPLSDRIRTTSLPEKQAIAVGIQIAAALEAAHEKGIIHRDLKPQNIILAAQGQVKVVDFGLAKVMQAGNDADVTVTMTDTDAQAGTLPYMSPEQLRGEPGDARSDIWGAGAVLYEVCTAQRPFPENRSTMLIDAILNKQPAPPRTVNPRISAGLEQIILKALDKEPSRRYQSAREMRVDLERLAEGRQSSSNLSRASASKRRAVVIWAAAAIVVIALAWIGIAWWQAGKKPQTQQTVLIGEIVNRTGNQIFDQTLTELLTTALEQSRVINVFPAARVPDVLERMEKKGPIPIDEALGREICDREGLRAVVLGSISPVGSGLLMLIRAVDPSGRDLVSIQQTIANADGVSSAIDRMVNQLRTGLGENAAAVQQASLPLARVTSSSLEAVKYYTLGKQKLYAGDPESAINFFQKALDLDPHFAEAIEGIGISYTNIKDYYRAEKFLGEATMEAGHVPEIERQQILGNYAMVTTDYTKACDHFQILTQLQPLDPSPFLSLGWCKGLEFDYDAAIANTQKSVDLLPSLRTRVNLAMLTFMKGDSSKALTLTETVLKDFPGNPQAIGVKGEALLLSDKLTDARSAFDALVQMGGDNEVIGRNHIVDMAMASGRMRDARSELEAYRLAARRQGNTPAEMRAEILLAELSPEGTISAASDPRLNDFLRSNTTAILMAGRMYAAHHRMKEAEAMKNLMEENAQKRGTPVAQSLANMIRAEIALADGKAGEALDAARKGAAFENSPLAEETLARALEANGEFQESGEEFEKVLARENQRSESYDGPAFHKVVELHYRLGVVFAKLGRDAESKKELEKFMNYWTSADPELEIYKDAVARLRTLGVRVEPSTGMPTPAMYSADSVIPSTRRSRSINVSLNTAVQNGARPSQVATRQNVWQAWPASRRTTR
jgi:tetratricopeptide (TPR) repeat protein/tRNA A-37 threonylcarbamoyl transferase component Bud32